ncbi:MAG: ABC transporter ATP-binding protein [Eubacteriaceae bacterium]
MTTMIKTVNILKKYGKQIAVDNLNVDIPKGMSYALLGPNGAGKTTTLRMISSLLRPTSGEVFINGQLMNRKNKTIKKDLGMVSQHVSLQREMTPVEVLKMHGMLHKMKRKDINDKIDSLLDFANMKKDKNKLVNKLSGGNKRKLMIIRAVMHQPKVLFLDEPTVGLDANIRRSIWDLLKKLKNDGMTTILTTHYIEEARNLCDMIGMMYEGKIIAQDSPEGFMKTIEPYVVEKFDGDLTSYEYFTTREVASEYVSKCKESTLIRKTNLEDVYVKYTHKKMN